MNSKRTTTILAVLLVSLSAMVLMPSGIDVAGENQGTVSGNGITVEYVDSAQEGTGLMTVTFTGTPDDTEFTVTIDGGRTSAPIPVTSGMFAVPGGLSAGNHALVIQCGDDVWNLTLRVSGAIHATGIDIRESSISLSVGGKRTLSALVIPDGAAEQDIIWSSSDDTVATVHNGTVTAVAVGTALITAMISSPAGIFEDTCSVSVRDQPDPPHSHSWDSGKVTKEPTCTESGTRLYTCSCGDTRTETIPALGHQWSEWKVVKEASETEEGLKERTCRACGEKETATIPKLTPGGDDTEPSDDDTILYVGIGAAAVAAVSLVAIVFLRRP